MTDQGEQPQPQFKDFDLSAEMLAALEHAEYQTPTPVQAGIIPGALDGEDLIGQAQTGTGKTAAFAIPILEQLSPADEIRSPQALVLAPTRELAVQVSGEFEKLSYKQQIKTVTLYGGKPIRGQIEQLKGSVQVVVGTPGRILDHIQRKTLDLSKTWCTVLDEADRMLDIGFRPDIEKILGRCTCKDRQTLLLSATVPSGILGLAKRFMYQPTTLNFSPKELSVDTIDQYYYSVEQRRKLPLLLKILRQEEPHQSIVFCRTKRRTERVYQQLKQEIGNVSCIHGDLQQGARDRVMGQFREGKVRCLVATDVVGRGIDVTGVSHIFNFDLPQSSDDYVHRVGRTGRMGREGVAYSFVLPDQGSELTGIEQRINRLLERLEMEGFEAGELAEENSGPPPPPPPSSLLKRPRKRYRRGL
ncbi:MAG: DEAD/DEAH box helicase [Pirellulaceae bacterium]|nr:DEAD/DEAH box helicase [Pirellulaceae bacterium]